ncbi:MAG: GTP pyrophosphokinase [Anaerovoracaceae bacterium]|jgi:(p)ppGpp synthase/HD superfamily hydrolase
MIYTEATILAAQMMFRAHQGQTDRGGLPYCFHPWHVAESMTTEEETCAALLHDVVEDTGVTLADLEQAGFSRPILEAISLLTHDETMSYLDYVRRLADHPIARRVKRADLTHNSDLTRLPVVTDRDRRRLETYRAAMEILDAAADRAGDGG